MRASRSAQNVTFLDQGAAEQERGIAGAEPRWGRPGHGHLHGSAVFTVMAALAQMELEIKRQRITDSVAKHRAAGKDLGGRRATFTDSQILNAVWLTEGGESATQVVRDLGMSRATFCRRIRELPTLSF